MDVTINGVRQLVQNDNCFAEGYAFWGDKLIQGEALSAFFKQMGSLQEIVTVLKNLSGHFVAALSQGNYSYLISDIPRTRAMYWTIRGSKIIASDNAFDIINEDTVWNHVAAAEAGLLGYVTGTETLFHGIQQTLPGEIVIFHNEEFEQSMRYFEISAGSLISSHEEKQSFISKMTQSYRDAIDKLIVYANGRQIVLPLSGGLDGRTLLAILKQHGYDNILTFTYGKKLKEEVLVSKKVAEYYGVRWICVPYVGKRMKVFYHAGNFQKLIANIGNCGAYPHIQDWYAVYYLLLNKQIERDAVLMPGHAVSTLAELSPKTIETLPIIRQEDIFEMIYGFNYIYWKPKKVFETSIKDRLNASLCMELAGKEIGLQSAYTAIKSIGYRERQAKSIVGSVEIYRSFGLDYYMPLLDTELYNLWNLVPLDLASKRRICYEALEKIDHRALNMALIFGHDDETGREVHKADWKKVLIDRFPKLYKLFLRTRNFKTNMNLWGYTNIIERIGAWLMGQKFADSIWIHHWLRNFETAGNQKRKGGGRSDKE